MRRVILIAALALGSLATAQRCQLELTETVAGLPNDLPPGVVAAELLAKAVKIVEPALPPLLWNPSVPLEPEASGYEAVRYLAERQLLPQSWQPDELTTSTWHSMLTAFLRWYGHADLELPGGEDAPPALVSDLSHVLERVGESVRPVVLVASSSEDSREISFLGLVWNWTVYPRLIVLRTDPELDLREGMDSVLERLSNCAVDLEHFVLAPENTARSLFLSHADAQMYVIGSEPQRPQWPLQVPLGEEQEYFAFAVPELEDLTAFAAAFDGGSVGVGTLVRMLPRLRTNLAPYRIPGILSTPGSDR